MNASDFNVLRNQLNDSIREEQAAIVAYKNRAALVRRLMGQNELARQYDEIAGEEQQHVSELQRKLWWVESEEKKFSEEQRKAQAAKSYQVMRDTEPVKWSQKTWKVGENIAYAAGAKGSAVKKTGKIRSIKGAIYERVTSEGKTVFIHEVNVMGPA